MNLETKITIYKFTPQVFTLTRFQGVHVNQDVNRKNIMNTCQPKIL